MDSTPKLLGFFLLLWITASAKASPNPLSKNEITGSTNIVGIASQIIANALIKGQADSTSNYIVSPIGYATILSILGHGSYGQTRNEIFQVLGQPNSTDEVREAYRVSLSRYSGNDSVVAPQFKTWFYIYRNNSAETKFKQILAEDYLVEIKDIDRFEYDFDSVTTSEQETEIDSPKSPTINQDASQFEDFKEKEENNETETSTVIDEKLPSVQQALADYDQINEDEKNKVSKFDKYVDDKQYFEVPDIKEQKEFSEKAESESTVDEKNEGPEKISLPLKKYVNEDNHHENNNFINQFGKSRAHPLHLEGDVTSALSGNSIVGRKAGESLESSDVSESKMLLFNGLYFRGNWQHSFNELRSDEIEYFHSPKGKQEAKFMKTHGTFKYTSNPSKKLIAVELPYKNERYSMVVVLPDSEESLRQFSKDSSPKSLNDIFSRLEPTEMHFSLPKFKFECTTRAEKALGKLGLTTLFTSKADLAGITKDARNFQIKELVQHVAIRVDEGSSSESTISAGNIEGRNNGKTLDVKVRTPFFFYVRDVFDDIILVAGKVMEIPVDHNL